MIFIENMLGKYLGYLIFSRYLGGARYLGKISGISRNIFRRFYEIFVARLRKALSMNTEVFGRTYPTAYLTLED